MVRVHSCQVFKIKKQIFIAQSAKETSSVFFFLFAGIVLPEPTDSFLLFEFSDTLGGAGDFAYFFTLSCFWESPLSDDVHREELEAPVLSVDDFLGMVNAFSRGAISLFSALQSLHSEVKNLIKESIPLSVESRQALA